MNTDHTLEEVGQQFSEQEKEYKFEAKGLRKLMHPSRSRIRSFLDN